MSKKIKIKCFFWNAFYGTVLRGKVEYCMTHGTVGEELNLEYPLVEIL